MGLGIERINRMNNKWRPPNWVVPEYIAECNYCLFEAGANAIYGALLKSGKPYRKFSGSKGYVDGIVIFITNKESK